jgi:hypothetical protein
MYEPTPDLSRLRQGDVIKWAFLPRFSNSNVLFLHEYSKDGNWIFKKKAIIETNHGYAVILSQCCEFNEGKRLAFSLSELLPFRYVLNRRKKSCIINIAELVAVVKSPFRGREGRELDQIERLRSSNKIESGSKNESVNVFLFEADGTFLTEPYIADFSRVTSVSMDDMKSVLKNKVLQLGEEQRRQFQVKLAYFYARPVQ